MASSIYDFTVKDQQGKSPFEPDHRDFLKNFPADEAAHQPADQIGKGLKYVQMAPYVVDDGRQGAQGKDDGHGVGKGPPTVQPAPGHEQGDQHHSAAPAEKAVDDARCAPSHGSGHPRFPVFQSNRPPPA